MYSVLIKEKNENCGYALLSDTKQTKETRLLKYERESVVGEFLAPIVEYAYSMIINTWFGISYIVHFLCNYSANKMNGFSLTFISLFVVELFL